MITREGFTKDTGVMAEGICVTFGQDMMKEKGGVLSFLKHFENSMGDDDIWLHKSKNEPTQPIAFVYIIVLGRVKYKLNYVGYESGPRTITCPNGITEHILWPRVILAGPIVHAPIKLYFKGFQGFRYCNKLF